MYGMRKTTVYLPDELKRRLEQAARERDCSEADVIRNALEEFTTPDRRQPRLPLFKSGVVRTIDDFDEALKGFGED